jgi:hypothetical protein
MRMSGRAKRQRGDANGTGAVCRPEGDSREGGEGRRATPLARGRRMAGTRERCRFGIRVSGGELILMEGRKEGVKTVVRGARRGRKNTSRGDTSLAIQRRLIGGSAHRWRRAGRRAADASEGREGRGGWGRIHFGPLLTTVGE